LQLIAVESGRETTEDIEGGEVGLDKPGGETRAWG